MTVKRIGPQEPLIARINHPNAITAPDEVAQAFLWRIENPDANPDDFEGDKRIPLIVNALERLQVKQVEGVLGAGSFGLAVRMTNGRVLKLTSDAAEVRVGVTLIGKDLPHVVAIYGAWFMRGVFLRMFAGMDLVNDEPTFVDAQAGILMEQRVEPLQPTSLVKSLSRFVMEWKDETGNQFRDYANMSEEQKRQKLRIASMELEEALHQRASEIERMMEAYSGSVVQDQLGREHKLYKNVGQAIGELRSVGVFAIDVHGGNVGFDMRTQEFRVFDVGVGSPPPDARKPEVLPTSPEATTRRPGRRGAPGKPEQLSFHFREGLALANAVLARRVRVEEL